MALVFHNSPNVFSQITAFLSHKCKVMRNIIYGVMQNVPKCVRRQAWRIGERIARKAIYLWYQKHKRAGGESNVQQLILKQNTANSNLNFS